MKDDRTHKGKRHGRVARPRYSEVVSVGHDGFKIGSIEGELPRDRPSVEDIALAHRPGCGGAILRFFMRRKYGTDYTESTYKGGPERCTHGILLSEPCERCRAEYETAD